MLAHYKSLISACSITIYNNDSLIYDEVDITELFLKLFHNAINRHITLKSIKYFMINNFNLNNNYEFKLTIVDDKCNIYQLNEQSSIAIDTLTNNALSVNYKC